MTTSLETYAAKWATTEQLAGLHYDQARREPSILPVVFEWAKADPDSPVAKLLSVGVSESTVLSLFSRAFDSHKELLQKFNA